jgi:hypothetical protein
MKALKSPGFINPGEKLTPIDVEEIQKLYKCKPTEERQEKLTFASIRNEIKSLKRKFKI